MTREKCLTLAIKRDYFYQIKAGVKGYEYRVVKDYWLKRLVGKSFNKIILTLGYPKSNDRGRRLEFPWRGYKVMTITHSEFGGTAKVFAIRLVK